MVEVLLATVILAIGLIGTSAFFYANRRNLYNARLERYATWSAVERMEHLKGKPYSSLGEGTEIEEVMLGDNVLPAERTTTIVFVDEDDITFKSVNVEVAWGEDREISLTTYIYD